MKKINLLILLCLGIVAIGFTQDFNIEVSEPYRVINANHKFYFTENEQIMAVKIHGNDLYIQKWKESSMEEILRLEHNNIREHLRAEKVLKIQNKYYLFFSSWDRTNNIASIYSWELDFETGEFIGDEKLLLAVDGYITRPFGEIDGLGSTRPKLNIELSADETVVLIQYLKLYGKMQGSKIIGVGTFDGANMNLIWKNELHLETSGDEFEYERVMVDDNAEVYFLLKNITTAQEANVVQRKKVYYNYELIHVNKKDENNHRAVTITEEKDIYITSVKPAVQKNGNVVFFATYSDSKYGFESSKGIIMFTLNENGTTSVKHFYDYDQDVLIETSKLYKKSKDKPAEKYSTNSIRHLKIRDVLRYNDGSFLITSEQQYSVSSIKANNTENEKPGSHFKDILLTRIDANGNLIWMKRLIKNQYKPYNISVNHFDLLSFKYFSNSNNHFLIFHDDKKSLEYNWKDGSYVYDNDAGEALYAMYVINDESGDFEKKYLMYTRKAGKYSLEQFGLERVVQTSEDQFIIEAYKGGSRDVLVKLKP